MIPIDPAQLSERDNYKLLIGSIIPRPIALVTTLSADGLLNAAPFSYFNIVSANPPMLSVSVQRKQGVPKHTAVNALATGSFVVHIADETYIDKLNRTAAGLPAEQSEVDFAGLTAIPSVKVSVPGVTEARIRMECTLELSLPIGGTEEAPSADLLIGRIVCFHFDEALYDGNGHIDAHTLLPVSRLAGAMYSRLGETFELPRPD